MGEENSYKVGDLSKLLSFGSGDQQQDKNEQANASAVKKKKKSKKTPKKKDQQEHEVVGTESAESLFTTEFNTDLKLVDPALTKKRKKQEVEKAKEEERAKKLRRKEDDLEQEQRTLFVANVPVNAAPDLFKLREKLKKLFKEAGPVDSVRVRSLPIAPSAIPADSSFKTMIKVSAINNNLRQGNNLTCNAYVVFKNAETLYKVLEEEEQSGREWVLGESRLRLDRVGSKATQLDESRTVFVGNLSFETTEDSLRVIFAEEPKLKVQKTRIVRDRVTNMCKGVAFVMFESKDMVNLAVKAFNEQEVEGRTLRVTRYGEQKNNKKKKTDKETNTNNKKAPFKKMKKKGDKNNAKSWQGSKAVFKPSKHMEKRMKKGKKSTNTTPKKK